MTPSAWTAAMLAASWKEQHRIVEQQVRAHFIANPLLDGEHLTTNELVEVLFPERFAIDDGITARNLIYKRLLAKGKPGEPMWQDAYRYRGPARQGKCAGYLKAVQPWYWHAAGKPAPDPLRVSFLAAVNRAPEYSCWRNADGAIELQPTMTDRELIAFATTYINSIVDATEPANAADL